MRTFRFLFPDNISQTVDANYYGDARILACAAQLRKGKSREVLAAFVQKEGIWKQLDLELNPT